MPVAARPRCGLAVATGPPIATRGEHGCTSTGAVFGMGWPRTAAAAEMHQHEPTSCTPYLGPVGEVWHDRAVERVRPFAVG